MSANINLPSDVLAALQAGNKIEAIKLLREHRPCGLKEAKDQVDAYLAAPPEIKNTGAVQRQNASGCLWLLTVLIVGALIYWTQWA